MTELIETVRWDLLGGGFQIALCVGILFSWLRRRMKRRPADPVDSGAVSPVFAQEMFQQTIRQQTERAWQNILAVVEAERERLQLVFSGFGSPSRAAESESGGPAEPLASFRWGDSEPDGIQPDRYAGLDELAQQGLSSRQIADRMNLSAGEVELALKFSGASHANHPSEANRQ
jgi:hypothetical protein